VRSQGSRAMLYALIPQADKAIVDRWSRRISAFYIAVAMLLIALATMTVPSPEQSATASIGSTSQVVAKPERPNIRAARSETTSEARLTKRN
jgi:hypothetical protein